MPSHQWDTKKYPSHVTDLPKVKDELHGKRQEGKKEVGPAVLMEIFGRACAVGLQKGYLQDGWWKTRPRYTYTNLLKSMKRHMIAIDNGEPLLYNEYHPKTADPILANHADALFWGAAMLAMYNHFEIEGVDDRWLNEKQEQEELTDKEPK